MGKFLCIEKNKPYFFNFKDLEYADTLLEDFCEFLIFNSKITFSIFEHRSVLNSVRNLELTIIGIKPNLCAIVSSFKIEELE